MGMLFRVVTKGWLLLSSLGSFTRALDERLMLQLLRPPLVVTVTWTLPLEVPELLRSRRLGMVGAVLPWWLRIGVGLRLEERLSLLFGVEEREVGARGGVGERELEFRLKIGGGVSDRVADRTVLAS